MSPRRRGYAFVDHTADVGIRATGDTREELFANAAAGLMAAMVDLRRVRESSVHEIAVSAGEGGDEELMVAFLSEVLYVSMVKRLLFRRFEVSFPAPGEVAALAFGEPVAERHRVLREVKAVTYHQASVERDARGYRGLVILDI